LEETLELLYYFHWSKLLGNRERFPGGLLFCEGITVIFAIADSMAV